MTVLQIPAIISSLKDTVVYDLSTKKEVYKGKL